ncbi:hypothetical protein SAMN06265222_101658 [Neorhodopirellula lusitana]|uniref:Uncharacterized protein n=1 Tax=Neorhodopirellula lusitana TaxID=445327 RepID=A0ABY1PPW6_9BACT|nr:hypothetical protein SAMN06265222_101658 [Neorhodopirellula lusitana]
MPNYPPQPREPDGADIGLFLMAILFLMMVFGLPACIVCTPAILIFDVKPGNNYYLAFIGLVDFLMSLMFLGWLQSKNR